ncbi:MAG: 50S ribosomal protein L16 [Planctomycetes bacterium]|nr:50S ribosomal protein L16 [Planctomycetota bacterium]
MALMPKRVKYRKQQRGRVKGNAHRGHTVEFGDFGLQALDPAWVTARQIEAARIAANQIVKGEGKLFIRIFPHKPVSGLPAETRMGKGKGEPEYYAAVVRPGTVIFEVQGLTEDRAKMALNRAAHKFPIRCKMVRRRPKL